jgi:cephalosporin hydroxylase
MKYPLGQRLTFDRDATLRQYWKARLRLHHFDSYKGLPMAKMSEDLKTYEHVIWATQPKVIVELGSGSTGASGLWFADQLSALCGGGKVVSIEVTKAPELQDPRITFLQGNLTEQAQADEIKRLAGDGPVMVVEDSRHDYDTTLAALRLYSPLVSLGHFFIVEDTIIDEPDLTIFGDHGVTPAIDTFLEEEPRFLRRADMDLYGVTMHMGGWLECVK